MRRYRAGIRAHFGDMEDDYIKIRGELKQLRFDHRELRGRSSQQIERLAMNLEEYDQRFGAPVGGGGGAGRNNKGAAGKKGGGAAAAKKGGAAPAKGKAAAGGAKGRSKSPDKKGPAARAKSPSPQKAAQKKR